MKTPRLILAGLLVPAFLSLTGCETVADVQRVDPNGRESLRSLSQIDVQDWQEAADEMVDKLVSSGVLAKAPKQPAVMQISRIINNTQQQVDTDSLIKKIRVRLLNTGQVMTLTEDRLAQDAKEMDDMLKGKKKETLLPYYTLSGKLIENRVRSGSQLQVTYTFQLSLTTVKDGLGAWEGEKLLSKKGKSGGSVGF
jgi:uncharacterized protein (TIGR02722 family)